MAHVITEPCVGPGGKAVACAAVCPVDCIHPKKDEAGFDAVKHLSIDSGSCIDCGLCVDACPVKAIFPEASVPSEWHGYIQLNADYFKNR